VGERHDDRRGAVISALIREARPKQWAKNVLVFAAPAAAGVIDNSPYWWRTLVAFVAMCMASSGTYYWNDILDYDSDRRHPTKRFRPIAAGRIPLPLARVIGVLLLAGGLGLAFALNWQTGVTASTYVVLTSLYSAVFKHIAVVDLFVVAAGFVLRAIVGATANDVPASTWFLLTISFASLFIVTGKRYAELRDLGSGAETRATLEEYSLGFLRIVLSVSCGSALLTYCLWAFETAELAGSSWPFYELSIVPMGMALMRYTLILEQGHGAAPEEIFLADRTLQILGLIWAAVFGLGVYAG
jgi:decaprenyl-phosphate phosphoribosyltransferase